MANVNDLKNRVEIWKYSKSVNTAGTPVERWAYYKNCYANIKIDSGGLQNIENSGNVASTAVTITIRYDKAIDYSHQIRYGGQVYSINYIQTDNRKTFMTLKCRTYNEYINE